jgi:hypothetical protein
MSGLKIDSQFESVRAIFWGIILQQAAKLSPKKIALFKKRCLSFLSFSSGNYFGAIIVTE